MGDVVTLLNGLNLSPINTLLLAVLIFIFTRFDARLKDLELRISKHGKIIAIVKDRLGIEEEDD